MQDAAISAPGEMCPSKKYTPAGGEGVEGGGGDDELRGWQ